jgi:biofilm PGA synthesis protein PgaA
MQLCPGGRPGKACAGACAGSWHVICVTLPQRTLSETLRMLSPTPLALCVGMALLMPGLAVAGPDVDLGRIAQLRDQGQWIQALPLVQQARQQDPDDPELYRLNTLLLADIGNAYKAWELYQARPSAFEPAHAQRLESDYLARLVNWSRARAGSEDARLDEASDAEARLIQYLDRSGTAPDQAPLRIRLDRLILLNRLGRHEQLRQEVQAMQAQGHALPSYVAEPVGASLMASGHPDEAIPFLEAAVAAEPEVSQIRTELAYAYLEDEQASRALAYLQAWQAQEPAWRYARDARQPYQNWARYDADITLAMIRGYAGDLPQAQQDLEQLVSVAPRNGGLQTSLGTVYGMRGWPTLGLERHRIAHHMEPTEVSPRLGMISALTDLQRQDLARPLHDELLERYPTRPDVQRMQRHWRADRGWQLHAWTTAGRSRGNVGNSPMGNEDRSAGLEVQTPLLDDRWRAFAWVEKDRVDYDGARVDPLWRGAGVRYAYDRLDAELAVAAPGDGVGDTGLAARLGWRFSDTWHASLIGSRNDRDASSQARAAGITADRLEVQASYTPHERAAVDFSVGQLRYDDGNRRDFASVAGWQRLATRPTWVLDGLGSVYSSRGSRDDAPYYNPSRDGSVEVGLRLDQQLWRRYDRHFRHRLSVSLGNYWQRDYGSGLVPSAQYMHEWQFGPGRVLEYGLTWSRPVYDGNRERHIGFEAGLRWGQ